MVNESLYTVSQFTALECCMLHIKRLFIEVICCTLTYINESVPQLLKITKISCLFIDTKLHYKHNTYIKYHIIEIYTINTIYTTLLDLNNHQISKKI